MQKKHIILDLLEGVFEQIYFINLQNSFITMVFNLSFVVYLHVSTLFIFKNNEKGKRRLNYMYNMIYNFLQMCFLINLF